MKIDRIKHQDIDKEKYDECINKSLNGTIYALSWYLDIASANWDLLATPDYSFVMPLPVRKKKGLCYVIQPLACQQLGVFSSSIIDENILNAFLKRIPTFFCYLHLNSGNISETLPFRPNYILNISKSYDLIKQTYNRNTKAQLKKTYQLNLSFDKNIDILSALDFAKENSIHYTSKLYEVLSRLIKEASKKDILYIRGVRNDSGILAISFFFFWNNCFYYLLPVSTHRGKELQAMRFLLDNFISEFSGQGFTIDFEGSSALSVAQFYKSMGGQLTTYPVYEKGHLSSFFNLIKKYI